MKTYTAKDARKELSNYASQEYAKTAAWFFKTGPGQYGEGDKFIGVRVPIIRKVAKKYLLLSLLEISTLLESPIHEERVLALTILTLKYKKGSDKDKKEIYNFYLSRTDYINNWDLVDLSVHKIVGAYLWDNPSKRSILYRLVKSTNLWERRMSIVATFYFIAQNEIDETFNLALKLLSDKHDLIHKAVGWALREAGKKDEKKLKKFLKDYYQDIPRTTLRYAIERFGPIERQKYLKATFN